MPGMRLRAFGGAGPQVSELGHGTWAMGSMWGSRDDTEALKALRRGLELGIHFWDTAFVYGKGHSERLLGRAIKEYGAKPFVATKCPPKSGGWPPKPGTPAAAAFPASHLIEMTETSLKNLGQETLDLQQLHVWNDEWLHHGDWLETLRKLKDQGKIKYFGVSLNDHQPDNGLKLVASGLVDSVQVIYNLFDQRAREKLFPLCREKGVAVIVRVPLDEGGLSGTLSPETSFAKGDWRSHYFKEDRVIETYAHAKAFDFLVRAPYKSLAQAAIKFCLMEPAVSTVLVGMRSVKHVEANVEVSEFEGFSEEELKKVYTLAWPRNYYPSHD